MTAHLNPQPMPACRSSHLLALQEGSWRGRLCCMEFGTTFRGQHLFLRPAGTVTIRSSQTSFDDAKEFKPTLSASASGPRNSCLDRHYLGCTRVLRVLYIYIAFFNSGDRRPGASEACVAWITYAARAHDHDMTVGTWARLFSP